MSNQQQPSIACVHGLVDAAWLQVLKFDAESKADTESDTGGSVARMVCFCTNVAETSITVPGVRIVVDSGLAKEARVSGLACSPRAAPLNGGTCAVRRQASTDCQGAGARRAIIGRPANGTRRARARGQPASASPRA